MSSLESNVSKFNFRTHFQTSSFTHPRDPKHKGKSFTFQEYSITVYNVQFFQGKHIGNINQNKL